MFDLSTLQAVKLYKYVASKIFHSFLRDHAIVNGQCSTSVRYMFTKTYYVPFRKTPLVLFHSSVRQEFRVNGTSFYSFF